MLRSLLQFYPVNKKKKKRKYLTACVAMGLTLLHKDTHLQLDTYESASRRAKRANKKQKEKKIAQTILRSDALGNKKPST